LIIERHNPNSAMIAAQIQSAQTYWKPLMIQPTTGSASPVIFFSAARVSVLV
jgi:hypothetical protein